MASITRGIAFIFLLSLLFATTVSAQRGRPRFPRPRFFRPRPPRSPPPPSPSPPPRSPPPPSPSPPPPSPPPPSPSPPPPSPPPPSPSPPPPSPPPPSPSPPPPSPPPPSPSPPPPSPSPPPPSPPPPSPSPPPPSPPPPAPVTCTILPVRLLVCAPVVRNLREGVQPARFPCCTLINRLSDGQAKVCACTAGFRGFLGIRITIPQEIAALLTFCGKSVPSNFTCS